MSAVYELTIPSGLATVDHLTYILSFTFTRLLLIGHVSVMKTGRQDEFQIEIDLSDSNCKSDNESVRKRLHEEISKAYHDPKTQVRYMPQCSARDHEAEFIEYEAYGRGETI